MVKRAFPKSIFQTMTIMIASYFLMTMPVNAQEISDGLKKSLANLWDKYWFYIAIFITFGVLTGLLAFIILFVRLARHATNPQERSRIFHEMMAVAATTAALGAINLIVALYLSIFN
jgi:heme/copper-type cytochrome/quinol oxidase subunit 2